MTRILLATDGSPACEAATVEAIRLAAMGGVTLVALCSARELAPRVNGVLAEVEARAQRAKVACETIAATGEPAEQICAVARARDVGLVVVGTHGRGPVGRLLRGSVSQDVMRNCDRPVLVVSQTD